VAPAALKVPAVQEEHDATPPAAFVPAAHDVQVEAAAALYLPPSQFTQHAEPFVGPAIELYLPAAQLTQSETAAPGAVVETMYFPASQSTQTEVDEYFPMTQVVHDAAPRAEIEPPEQAAHVTVPVETAKVPEAQLMQVPAEEAEYFPIAHAVQTPTVRVGSE
jgi:hypothetical protein